jgi:hypothetical protein
VLLVLLLNIKSKLLYVLSEILKGYDNDGEVVRGLSQHWLSHDSLRAKPANVTDGALTGQVNRGIFLLEWLPYLFDHILWWELIENTVAANDNEVVQGVLELKMRNLWLRDDNLGIATEMFYFCMGISESSRNL